MIQLPLKKQLHKTKRRLAYDHSLPINNYFDVQYYTELYIGSNKEKASFTIDTGSEWTWLMQPDSECFLCSQGAYDP